MKIDGRCHCGRIVYEAEIDPQDVYICHCTDCQMISGSAFRWAVPVAEKSFRLLAGEPRTYVKTTAQGAASYQLFCADCASPLYSTAGGDGPRVLNLRLGTARQRAQLRPSTEYWCRSALSWAADIEPSTRHETQ